MLLLLDLDNTLIDRDAAFRAAGAELLATHGLPAGDLDGWVISEAVGFKKPSPEIFHAAAAVVGRPLSDAWMIGDSAHADIGGAHALGLPSTWISLGRPWTEAAYHPTHIETDAAAAIGKARG